MLKKYYINYFVNYIIFRMSNYNLTVHVFFSEKSELV